MTETLDQLATPALILDRDKLAANARTMVARAERAGVVLRPHGKTAKSAEVLRMATPGNALTVSTLGEAEYFADRGFDDLTYAVCITRDKLPRAAAVATRGARLHLLVDSVEAARDVADFSDREAVAFEVFIEIDSGEHRSGIAPQSDELLAIAEVIHRSPELALRGVLTHGGHSYDCPTASDIAEVAEQERASVVLAARRLRDGGFPCPVVSMGSTPTVVCARSFDGITEIRPGVYLFLDLVQVALGVCAVPDIALSVVATVISHQPARGRLIVDAGALALSKDGGVASMTGYGRLVDLHSGEPLGDLHVSRVDQEHGYVDGTNIDFESLKIGSRVRILPNHACLTAACHRSYVVYSAGTIKGRWRRQVGW